jgi:hypothetical protein
MDLDVFVTYLLHILYQILMSLVIYECSHFSTTLPALDL